MSAMSIPSTEQRHHHHAEDDRESDGDVGGREIEWGHDLRVSITARLLRQYATEWDRGAAR
jgi:hypothetical protein